MFYFILAVAVIFGLIMGVRGSLSAAAEGQSVPDSRFAGVVTGSILGLLVFVILLMLWAVGWVLWVGVAGL